MQSCGRKRLRCQDDDGAPQLGTMITQQSHTRLSDYSYAAVAQPNAGGSTSVDSTPTQAEMYYAPEAMSSLLVANGLAHQLQQRCSAADIDELIKLQEGRLKEAMEERRKAETRALVAAVEECSVVGRLVREKDAEMERAARMNAALEARVRQQVAEAQFWEGVARSNEAAAAGLRMDLERAMAVQQQQHVQEGSGDSAAPVSCTACHLHPPSILLLPCRHLCLCPPCQPFLSACPLCASSIHASLQVFID